MALINVIPISDLLPYFKGEKKQYFYQDASDCWEEFKPHSSGCFPAKLIEQRRPNETLEVFAYRKLIWEPITKPTFWRIITSLGKIRRSQDWVITYPNNRSDFSKIIDDETLEQYCENEYPYFTSLTNWIFSVCLKEYLTDPNGVIFIMPLSADIADNEYVEPFTTVFNCCDVIYFDENGYCILNDPEGTYYMNKKTQEKGKAFFVVTDTYIQRVVQIDSKSNFDEDYIYEHGLGEMPVFRLGGIISESQGKNYLYESRISGILPELNEAVREYSDLQAGKVTNIYVERWEYTSHECTVCKGKGLVQNPLWSQGCGAEIAREIQCQFCSHGYVVAGPYSKVIVKPAEVGQQQVPLPPAGYIEKDVAIVELMDKSVADHIHRALSAINFQFLDQVPLNISGKGKEVDKDELNNTVSAIAEDLIRIMDNCYRLIAYYRYKASYTQDEINDMVPMIPVPERFDLLSSDYMQTELKSAKDAKINPIITSAMEIDYAAKRFGTQKEIRESVALCAKLDPFSNVAEDDKMVRLSNKGIAQEDYVISSNIYQFVQRALEENKEFYDMELVEQKKVMQTYAQEIIAGNDTAGQIVKDVTMNGLYDQNQVGGNGTANGVGNNISIDQQQKDAVNGQTGAYPQIGNTMAGGVPVV